MTRLDPSTLRASVTFQASVPVRFAQLLRNDKVIGTFAPQAPAGTLTPLRVDVSAGHSVQIDVSGATLAGLAAAVQARCLGKSVLVVEAGQHVGGLTFGGLGETDIGNKGAVSGLAREFCARVLDFYREMYDPQSEQVAACHEGFRFEPGVAGRVLQAMLDEAGVTVVTGEPLRHIQKQGDVIQPCNEKQKHSSAGLG